MPEKVRIFGFPITTISFYYFCFVFIGVSIAKNKLEANQILNRIFCATTTTKVVVVIEEFLEGYEVSALCFTDGHFVASMPLSQDHKKLREGNLGENTGGMGAIAPIRLSAELETQIEHILRETITAAAAQTPDGSVYKGLYWIDLGED